MVLTWRKGADGVGRLWSGPGTDALGTLWDDGQGQRAVLHIMGSKHNRAFAGLQRTDYFERVALRATEFSVTPMGLWMKLGADATHAGGEEDVNGSQHVWFSGAFPGAHARLSSIELAHTLGKLAVLRESTLHRPPRPHNHAGTRGQPSRVAGSTLSRHVQRLMPCILDLRADNPRTPLRSCHSCRTHRCAWWWQQVPARNASRRCPNRQSICVAAAAPTAG